MANILIDILVHHILAELDLHFLIPCTFVCVPWKHAACLAMKHKYPSINSRLQKQSRLTILLYHSKCSSLEQWYTKCLKWRFVFASDALIKSLEAGTSLLLSIYLAEFLYLEKCTDYLEFIRQNEIMAICYEHLFVGNGNVGANQQLLQKCGISHMLNCSAEDCKPHFPQQFKYRNLYLENVKEEHVDQLLYEAFDFIEDAHARGGRVLVYCESGNSRSGAILFAYLIWRMQLVFKEVFYLMREIRPQMMIQSAFMLRLVKWSQKIRTPLIDSFRAYRIAPHSEIEPTLVLHALSSSSTELSFDPK